MPLSSSFIASEMLVTGTHAQNQFSSTPGNRASAAGMIKTMPNGEINVEASAELRAKMETLSSRAANMAATGISISARSTKSSKSIEPIIVPMIPRKSPALMASHVPRLARFKSTAMMPPEKTARNFPSTIWCRGIGASSSVSSVPRSFSPAPRWIAGYTTPMKQNAIKK